VTVPGPTARLERFRARWHTATCTISRPQDAKTFDPDTGRYDDPPTVTVYAGACLAVPTGGDRVQEFGEGPVTLRSYIVTIMDRAVDVQVGDTVTVTSSRRDPLLGDGLELVVLDVPKSELATARRLVCEETL
jgi:hypothetical protein